jgi:hypothetical protein
MEFTMRWRLLCTSVLLLGAGWAPAAQSPTLKTVMRDKLANATALLEPLIARDFRQLAVHSENLSHITYTEIASWQSRPDPAYIKRAVAFLEAVKGLRTAIDRHDIERATAAYGALVTSCVRCHQQVGSRRGVTLPMPAPRVDPPWLAP